jgi:hypothetical protein
MVRCLIGQLTFTFLIKNMQHIYCDMTPESLNSEVTIHVYC